MLEDPQIPTKVSHQNFWGESMCSDYVIFLMMWSGLKEK